MKYTLTRFIAARASGGGLSAWFFRLAFRARCRYLAAQMDQALAHARTGVRPINAFVFHTALVAVLALAVFVGALDVLVWRP